MGLKKYISKRDIVHSKEPKAKTFKRKKGKLEFVIQEHAARRLHYDLRLEVDGVLKSWAIPKKPSLDPSIKRLAIHVEDHPFAYRNFEGTIAKGYGAGTVTIWDRGTYSVDEESSLKSEQLIREGLKKGILHFTLKGKKLKGTFSLVKLKQSEHDWLLIKKNDSFAEQPHSSSPSFIKPMLATLVDHPFDNNDWIFEIKWDGFRALAELNGQNVELHSRNLLTFNTRFPLLVKHLKKLNINAVLDGEIVVLDQKGISRFQLLQDQLFEKNTYFYVFDILYLNGKDLRKIPLIKRKALLKTILNRSSCIRYTEHIDGKGKAFFNACKQLGCEGIIGKHKKSLYQSGQRSRDWLKIKASQQQEAIICGFTEPKKGRKNFGALILGIYKQGKLQFAGHVGTGFTEETLKLLKAALIPMIIKKCPFTTPPKTNTSTTWVKPFFLCEVKFSEWTKENIMRQPVFLGLRKDKTVRTVTKEQSFPVEHRIQKYDFITHPDKLFWEKEGITKRDLLNYYESIASFLLPFLKDRPESLRRFPNGIAKPSFFQKNFIHPPDWISTIGIEHTNKYVNYLVIQNLESLLYAVNLGCIEIHPWFSRYQNLMHPDFLVFDLDPENITFDAVIETAQLLHEILEKIQVPNYCKTSGSRGLHIVVPLKAKYTYEQTKQFALLIAQLVHKQLPQITSLERSPKKRQKRVYIDCYQNNFGQTLAAPYSVRAKPGAPVSTPLEWKEVKLSLNFNDYNIFTTLDRLKQKGEILKPLLKKGIDMEKALKKIQKHFLV